MAAFLTGPPKLPLSTGSRHSSALCGRRPLPRPARIVVSAATDEIRPLNGTKPSEDLTPPPVRPVTPPPRSPTPPSAAIPPTTPASPLRTAPPPRPRPSTPYSSRQGRDDYQERSARPSRYQPQGERRSRWERPERSERSERADRPDRFERSDRREYRDNRRAPGPPFVPDPNLTYYTKCSTCQAVYDIDPTILGRGKKVACAVCGNEWFQKPERLHWLKDAEGLKDYPLEKKDDLISEARQKRRDHPRFRDGDRRDGARDRRGPRPQRSAFSVFIGNLPFVVLQEELEELVSSKVDTQRVAIVKDETGKSKGFAFADVRCEEDVDTLVNALDGYELQGRNISVRPGRKN